MREQTRDEGQSTKAFIPAKKENEGKSAIPHEAAQRKGLASISLDGGGANQLIRRK